MKTIFLASECAPIVKVGGLGDVAGALPKALRKLGVDITVCLPFYKIIDQEAFNPLLIKKNFKVEYEQKEHLTDVFRTIIPGSDVPVLLFRNETYLSGGGVYFSKSAFCESHREVERFSFFSKAVLEYIKSEQIEVDVFHCNDWHTAGVPLLLKTIYSHDPVLKKAATVFTIHNLGNQGVADLVVLDDLGVASEALESLDWDAQNRDIDLMMEGIIQSDIISTVSPTYALEIMTKRYGVGLEDVLRGKSSRVFGILNGIDYDVFNPATDENLFHNYSVKNWKEGKAKNKQELRRILKLRDDEKPLIGMVTRLTEQKGLGLVESVFNAAIKLGFQFVLVGLGDSDAEEPFIRFAEKYPGNVSINLTFDLKLASRVYAASDMFLMPSKFEPCGLGQLIALKYGTIPIVRATGGLKDTIQNNKTGFVFKPYSAKALKETLIRAFETYQNTDKWYQIVTAAMNEDFSWERSAQAYFNLYCQALQLKHE